MKLLFILLFILPFTTFAQCPSTISSLGNGNGLQICWMTGERPADIDYIWYDGVLYEGDNHNGGQGDCWRTNGRHRLEVLGNHKLEFIYGDQIIECDFTDGESDDILDLDIMYFDYEINDNTPQLIWESEDAEDIQLLRSENGMDFQTIYTTKSNTGSYLDRTARDGTYYYKLRIFDTLGYLDSVVKAITVDRKKDIWYNSQRSVLVVSTETPTLLKIYSVMGELLESTKVNGYQDFELNYSSGVYYVRLGEESLKIIHN